MPPAPKPARRVLLGTRSDLATRQRVYRIPDGLEVEDIQHFEVTCRRVFFDEVIAVTYHRFLDWPFLAATGALAALAAFVALLVGLGAGPGPGLATLALAGLPFALAFFLRLSLGVDVVTVHGKRSRARIHFWLRKARAREVFAQVCHLARERQQRVVREIAAEAAPPPPPGPEAPASS